ncbi:type II toxin-antitoxin system death-on-curing family toxin [Amorphus sp. 3PC139-8]|uniref:type II toxin-antitoxin system death-on-curing family toxin n=1 Tax=Amorphus sp. 3PC139-8 TaxID=2735676 RepID=UPI00345D285E
MTDQSDPSFLSVEDVVVIHDLQLRRFGGGAGLRDIGMLESAIGRVQSVHAYDEAADVVRLAATLCHALVANHPFVDGNKRAAYGAMSTFLAINGLSFKTDPVDAADRVLALADGSAGVSDMDDWLRQKVFPDDTYRILVDHDQSAGREPLGTDGPEGP